MKIRVRLGIATAFGLVVAVGSGFQARAQLGPVVQNPLNGQGVFNAFTSSGPAQIPIPPQGTWAEVINVTPKWMVVQNQVGQQFPIASDRVRQFLIRWPYSTTQLNQRSLVEVAGPNAGSNTVIADHLDVFEEDAQNLVSPSVNDIYGFGRTINPIDVNDVNTYGIQMYMTPEEYSIPNRLHVVGHPAIVDNAVRVEVAQNWFTVQPSLNGMSVTQVTIGNNSYARRGDLVYLVPENITPRSLDVGQLVLYKKVPFRGFQP